MEVNGTTKLNHLFVSGIVTFASPQTFSGVTYDSIIIRKDWPISGDIMLLVVSLHRVFLGRTMVTTVL